MSTELPNIVEASGKEIKVIDPNRLTQILDKLRVGVTQTASLAQIFKEYVNKFQGKANLGESARIINRDLENAQKGDIKELARKLDLTTITGAQQNNTASAANIQAQVATVQLATPKADRPNTLAQAKNGIIGILSRRGEAINAAVDKATNGG